MIQKKIKRTLAFFIVTLVLSGLTAFPIQQGLEFAVGILDYLNIESDLSQWVREVKLGVISAYKSSPYIAYGTDWLAFSHIIIAMFFIGPLRDPIKNKWVIEYGMIACIMVFPLALIGGPIREIPFLWQIIDCTFGVIGFITLLYCYALIRKLENEEMTTPEIIQDQKVKLESSK